VREGDEQLSADSDHEFATRTAAKSPAQS